MAKSSKSTRRQTTTRINGKRMRLVTQNGKTVVSDAPIEEWRLQAEAVRQLRAMPEYAASAEDATTASFTLAADFNAGKRDAAKAKATGVTAGETDLRVYGSAGRLLLVEYKNAEGRLSGDQKDRHALLRALGYRVEVIKASTPEECAVASVSLVRSWLAANDNNCSLAA
ncbi:MULTISPECIES: VRR-NUC domain-containing protein [unclassified Mesorhizobium]|uniref:VRR-NUC domain-containing protein n=1 Tax=unclassified Mesorhizobium TaxID=325217 RepID=UPI0011282929|nr:MULTISPECIES: VRR-NUC domain-containing protein [unclassified Mesorhizobium]TPJ86940.1 VRR-NUC domain-containing protein [Mesorhizobium sp. B2-5-12]TPK19163.1 VRR-NUC domain-containing protein [Mesorhizobium sp. B2-5-6]